jgi:preprotein translocase subunit YajC
MNALELLAMAAPPPAGQEANPTGQMLQMVGMFVILGVMFYFLLIRPQQKQRKEQDNLLKSIKSGDKILTSGGLFGIVTNVKEKSLMVKIADNVKVEIVKSAVTTVVQKGDDGGTASTEQK